MSEICGSSNFGLTHWTYSALNFSLGDESNCKLYSLNMTVSDAIPASPLRDNILNSSIMIFVVGYLWLEILFLSSKIFWWFLFYSSDRRLFPLYTVFTKAVDVSVPSYSLSVIRGGYLTSIVSAWSGTDGFKLLLMSFHCYFSCPWYGLYIIVFSIPPWPGIMSLIPVNPLVLPVINLIYHYGRGYNSSCRFWYA